MNTKPILLALFIGAGTPGCDPKVSEAASRDNSGTIEGTVRLNGTPPKPIKFPPTEYATCRESYPFGITYDPIDVNKEDNQIRSAFVYVKKGLEGKIFEVPKEPVLLVAQQCRFVPRVVGIRVGQELVIENKDPTWHSAHVMPIENQESHSSSGTAGIIIKRSFTKVEGGIKVRCPAHHWEAAWINVLEHPFYATTDAKGKFEIRGLPPGKYTLEVWQENCVPATQEIELKEKERKAIDFKLDLRKE